MTAPTPASAPAYLEYLATPLVGDGGLRPDLDKHAHAVAHAWLLEAVDPSPVEVAAETLARWAVELSGAKADAAQMQAAVAWIGVPAPVQAWIAAAAKRGVTATEVAALAVHLLDICEHLALLTFLPELPAMTAKADRTGDAARHVGLARHLKG